MGATPLTYSPHGGFKGACPLKLIKSFWSSFFQKACGGMGATPLTYSPYGGFKGACPLNSLKVFDPTFFKKLVGVLGVKPLTSLPYGGMGATPPYQSTSLFVFLAGCGDIFAGGRNFFYHCFDHIFF